MEADLSELDDWLGTLEELQLGLELCNSVTGARSNSNSAGKPPETAALSSSSCLNRTFLNDPTSPRCPQQATRVTPSAHFNPVSGESPDSYDSRFTSSPFNHLDPSQRGNVGTGSVNGRNGWTQENRASTPNGKPPIGTIVSASAKEATAERDLNCLLQELEVVEARMKELESENTTFTRRYSLASSPHGKRPCDQFESTDFTTASASNNNCNAYARSPPQSSTNGFVSAQWAAQLNHDLAVDREQSCSPPPPPPAFLGAGDACVSPPTSPQPSTPSSALLQQTEAGIWSMNSQNMSSREPAGLAGSISQPSHPYAKKPVVNDPLSVTNTNLLPFSQADNGLAGTGLQQGISIAQRQVTHQSNESPVQSNVQAALCGSVRAVDVTHANRRLVLPEPAPLNASRTTVHQSHQTGFSSNLNESDSHRPLINHPDGLFVSTNAGHRILGRTTDGDDDSSLSGHGSWSPGQILPKRDLIKTNSLVGQGGSDGQSNSLSPESSLSDKSISESTDSNLRTVVHPNNNAEGQLKKLVVRIFRPDRTTKAILIEEQMTAGEVASMMIEKNFLQPSTRLVVVEKVPALKIERVFEEHEKVSECILSWPTRSQNMLFFEERDDHFGLIESPGEWLGEEFVKKYRYESAEAMQMMLNNIEQAGFPEWRDYLYIRKPGDKTWSRRLCVLRSSGLYTSKKNRKSLNPTDLIRILVLDSNLQLYTTTGGWTRMRAPTPHGFAFKPYSAQDPASTHVFCFCATDEKALRHWVSRLRIAKYGRQLYLDYHVALSRVQRQLSLRHGGFAMNGSLSAGVHRKSSFEFLSSSSNPTLTTAESSTSLVTRTSSPSVFKRHTAVHATAAEANRRQQGDERQPPNQIGKQSILQKPNISVENSSVSPLCPSTHVHVGLRPRTPQNPVDPKQACSNIRTGDERTVPANANSHLSNKSSANSSRTPDSMGSMQQPSFRRS